MTPRGRLRTRTNGVGSADPVRSADRVSERIGADQQDVEAAVRATLRGWGMELDTRQKFWWMDWNRMIEDVVEATRTGMPVLYEEDEPELRSYLDDVNDSPIRDLLLTLDAVLAPRRAGRWLLASNRALGGKCPVEALAAGDIDAVRGAAERSVGLRDRGALANDEVHPLAASVPACASTRPASPSTRLPASRAALGPSRPLRAQRSSSVASSSANTSALNFARRPLGEPVADQLFQVAAETICS